MKELIGKVEIDPYGTWDDVDKGVFVGGENLDTFLFQFRRKRVRITVEELPEESKDDEVTVNLKLKTVVGNDEACGFLGLNPWCVAEGADGDSLVQIPLSKAREFGLI